MAELVMKAAVAVATIWENKARNTGRIFWKVVTDSGDNYTAFSRDLVARFINGRPSAQKNESLVYNFKPPLNTVLYFEATAKGKVLAATPEGEEEPPVEQPAAEATAPDPQQPDRPNPYHRTGYNKSGGGREWKPRDERPSLVTMTAAYAKDIVTAIIGNNDDLKSMDPDKVLTWAGETMLKVAKGILIYTLEELKTAGFKLEDPK